MKNPSPGERRKTILKYFAHDLNQGEASKTFIPKHIFPAMPKDNV